MVRATLQRALLPLIVSALMLSSASSVQALDAEDIAFTVTPETGGHVPYPRELVLLRIRGTYRATVMLEDLRQPSLQNFSWMQLGRDRWFKADVAGQAARGFERVIAVFPQHSGDFTIDPFVHRLTIEENGQRRVMDVASPPIRLEVAAWAGKTGGPDVSEPWWLAARSVSITDVWAPDPGTLKIGEIARRTVTVEARGVAADGLPPRPIMRTRGVLTFAGPTERQTTLTPEGPVARATYQWDVRPGVPEAVPLEAIKIPWFDTVSRTMRTAEIPARRVGAAPARAEDASEPVSPGSPLIPALAGIAAFGLVLALARMVAAGPSAADALGTARGDLIRAARRGDARSFRAVLDGVMRADPGIAAHWRRDPGTAEALAALDRHLFAAGGSAAPDLGPLARALSQARPPKPPVAAVRPNPLLPLDGRGGKPAA